MSSSLTAQKLLASTLTPFLYPCILEQSWRAAVPRSTRRLSPCATTASRARVQRRYQHNESAAPLTSKNVNVHQYDHLDPVPPDYSAQPFVDACTLSVTSGAGGHGCISFLREMFIAHGPPNGGDGGSGGSIYIQAVRGETSLHKIARRGALKAGRGKNGQGSTKGGARGKDIVIIVPPGTVVREISRHDPVAEEERMYKEYRRKRRDQIAEEEGDEENGGTEDAGSSWRRDKWLLYPGYLPKAFSTADIPAALRPRRSSLFSLQPPEPFCLDLDKPMEAPMLLAAGAMGGLGNPHFITKAIPRPKFASKGDDGTRIELQLELKLLADVGLVGLPNAGKSTLLRAVTRSRTRVGNWAFTTLSPSIGTVVLDNHVGRPTVDTRGLREGIRDSFTIADIPGLVEGAHLDRGLGLDFLRHIERAAVLAFVIDLSKGSAVQALKGLWHEVGQYEKLRDGDRGATVDYDTLLRDARPPVPYEPFGSSTSAVSGLEALEQSAGSSARGTAASSELRRPGPILPPPPLPPISSKPWMVIATKADLPQTQTAFAELQKYLAAVQNGDEEHPSGKKNAWRKRLHSLPVSAINKEGVTGLPAMILSLLNE